MRKNSIGHLLGTLWDNFRAPPPPKKNNRKEMDSIFIIAVYIFENYLLSLSYF